MRKYEIKFNDQVVGCANVQVMGLYYHFQCCCKVEDAGFYRLIISWNDGQRDLGTCLNECGNLVLERKVAVKHIGQGPFAFSLINPTQNNKVDKKLLLNLKKPFEMLEQIKETSRVQIENEKIWIIL